MNRILTNACTSCAGCTNSNKPACSLARQPTPGYRLFGRRSKIPMEPGSLWQIDTGIVRASTWNGDGTVNTLGFWGPGGLISCSLKGGEPFFVECLTSVSAKSLPPDSWSHCTDALMLQMQENCEYVEVIGCRRVPISLARLLKWLAKRFGRLTEQGYLLDMQLTHQDLADAVGSTRVTVTRTLKDLEQQGVCRRIARGRFLVAPPTLDIRAHTALSLGTPRTELSSLLV